MACDFLPMNQKAVAPQQLDRGAQQVYYLLHEGATLQKPAASPRFVAMPSSSGPTVPSRVRGPRIAHAYGIDVGAGLRGNAIPTVPSRAPGPRKTPTPSFAANSLSA